MYDATKLLGASAQAPTSTPKVKMKAVPLNSSSLQIVRTSGDTRADAFVIFDADTGYIADTRGCVFWLNLLVGDVEQQSFRGVVTDTDKGIVQFQPTEDYASISGFFTYKIEVQDYSGNVQTILKNSYVFKL